MANITNKDIDKISRLAQIDVDNSEQLANQINDVINWVEKLKEVDTKNVEPLINVHDNAIILNKDEISDGNISQDILKNAPKSIYGYFAVPKVIE
jgi:aspartyl-tRNA(Asn)/glutamyl-tRNA(Gln) amidotransferase subunit C